MNVSELFSGSHNTASYSTDKNTLLPLKNTNK